MPGFDLERIKQSDSAKKQATKADRDEINVSNVGEYLKFLETHPDVYQLSPNRFVEIIETAGKEKVTEEIQLAGAPVRYNLFSSLYGVDKSLHTLVNYLRAGAQGDAIGKQLLLLVGPPASGKSTTLTILKQALEDYDTKPVFQLENCPRQEEPLHVVPRYMRRSHWNPDKSKKFGLVEPIEDSLGISDIYGDLCPPCRAYLLDELKNKDTGEVRWWDFPVELLSFSQQSGTGIAVFEPGDSIGQSISDLVGHENPQIIATKGPSHPKAFDLRSGELHKAERGIIELREFFKTQREILNPFLSVAEERQIKIQGSTFPVISSDTVVIGHTNLEEYTRTAGDKALEAIHDRIYVIPVPYPLRIQDEIKIYRKLIKQGSDGNGEDFSKLQKVHIAPGSLELAATFAVLTRLRESNSGLDLLTKAKAYNGEGILAEIKDGDDNPIDVRSLIEEGQNDDFLKKREGMFGVSSRDILSALNMALVEEQDKNGCLTPIKTIRALRQAFEHRMHYTPEERAKFLSFLSSVDDGSVIHEYRNWVVEEVEKAFIDAYEDQVDEMIHKYQEEITAYINLHSQFIHDDASVKRDDLTGMVVEPDEDFMRSVEIHIPISNSQSNTFRGEMTAYFAKDSESAYEQMRRPVIKKILEDSRNLFLLVLSPSRAKEDDAKSRAKQLFDTLVEQGFCGREYGCARETVAEAAKILNE